MDASLSGWRTTWSFHEHRLSGGGNSDSSPNRFLVTATGNLNIVNEKCIHIMNFGRKTILLQSCTTFRGHPLVEVLTVKSLIQIKRPEVAEAVSGFPARETDSEVSRRSSGHFRQSLSERIGIPICSFWSQLLIWSRTVIKTNMQRRLVYLVVVVLSFRFSYDSNSDCNCSNFGTRL